MKIDKSVKFGISDILSVFADGLIGVVESFDRHGLCKKGLIDFEKFEKHNKGRFTSYIGRLQKQGLVNLYSINNQDMIELTQKGKERVKLLLAKDIKYIYPEFWDGKWRIVIFDIPEKMKRNRDIFRRKLMEIGFIKIQESVFIFPFDCTEIVKNLKYLFNIQSYVQYIIAEALESPIDLVDIFLKRKILKKAMIKKELIQKNATA